MPKEKNDILTPIIIVVESDPTKHHFWQNQFKNTEGDAFIGIYDNIEQAISTLEDIQTTCIAPKNTPQYELTKREKEVLSLLSKGFLYKEIAVNLNITLGSLKQYIHFIYKKLEVSNRTEALNKYKNPNKS